MCLRNLVVLLLCLLFSGCAVVSDKGRLDSISEYDKKVCNSEVKAIIYVEKDMSNNSFWGRHESHSSVYKNLQKTLVERFSNSGCFSNVEISPIAISNPPKDSLYVKLNREITYGNFLFENILALAIPMFHTDTYRFSAVVEYNNKKEIYEVEDFYRVSTWTGLILFSPFMEEPLKFAKKKNIDVIDALILSMKNDGFLIADDVTDISMANRTQGKEL